MVWPGWAYLSRNFAWVLCRIQQSMKCKTVTIGSIGFKVHDSLVVTKSLVPHTREWGSFFRSQVTPLRTLLQMWVGSGSVGGFGLSMNVANDSMQTNRSKADTGSLSEVISRDWSLQMCDMNWADPAGSWDEGNRAILSKRCLPGEGRLWWSMSYVLWSALVESDGRQSLQCAIQGRVLFGKAKPDYSMVGSVGRRFWVKGSNRDDCHAMFFCEPHWEVGLIHIWNGAVICQKEKSARAFQGTKLRVFKSST